MKHLKDDRHLRIKLSLTQQDFACYLDISRPLLALYEKGLRSLPTEALLKLARLESAFPQIMQEKAKQKQGISHSKLQQHDQKINTLLAHRAEDCRYQILLAQKKLKIMQEKYERAELWSKFIFDHSILFPSGNENNIDRTWLEVQKNDVVKKLVRYGKSSQSVLEVKIQALKAEENACLAACGKF